LLSAFITLTTEQNELPSDSISRGKGGLTRTTTLKLLFESFALIKLNFIGAVYLVGCAL
jgi:hypothetical protein